MIERSLLVPSLGFSAALALMCCGCAVLQSAGLPAVPRSKSMESRLETEIHLIGELTSKASEMDRWWALRDDRGVVFRLQPADSRMERRFLELQNLRVKVTGKAADRSISTPTIAVIEVGRAE